MIAVLVPVLARPASAAPLVRSLAEATAAPWRLVFLCSQGDREEIVACGEVAFRDGRVQALVVPWEAGPADWARKIQHGYERTGDPWLLLGADDLRFHPGWDEAALRVAEATGAGVVGTNDLGNRTVMAGRHSTHPLVRRSYVEQQGTIDEPGQVLHAGYSHQWVDTELCETAMARGRWAFAADSHVEHLHFLWGKSQRDATYDKALSTSGEDQALFRRRRALWMRDLRRAQRRSGAPIIP